MTKQSGSTRLIKTLPVSSDTLYALYREYLNSGDYDKSRSFIDTEVGSFLLNAKERMPDTNEDKAANFLQKAGINVILTPEGARIFATALKPDGTPKFSDGKVNFYTFEQKTIELSAENIVNNFKKGIDHAVSKGAEIAVIFDRYGLGHREQVEEAMAKYRLPKYGKMPKAVIVIDREGGVFEHHF